MQKFLSFGIAVLVVAALATNAATQGTYGTPGGSTPSESSVVSGKKMAEEAAEVDSDTVLQAQQQLHVAGFSPGPLNGLMGEKTREAIRQFQRARGLQVTGQIDPETSAALWSASGITAPSER